MALAKRNGVSPAASHPPMTINIDKQEEVSIGGRKLLAEAQKRKAKTYARQQKAAERVAAATSQLASGIAEAASAAEELRKAVEQIGVGAESPRALRSNRSRRSITARASSRKPRVTPKSPLPRRKSCKHRFWKSAGRYQTPFLRSARLRSARKAPSKWWPNSTSKPLPLARS